VIPPSKAVIIYGYDAGSSGQVLGSESGDRGSACRGAQPGVLADCCVFAVHMSHLPTRVESMGDGFDDFVLARGQTLLRFGYLLAGDRHLAEDLVQEVLAKAHRSWSRIVRLELPEAYLRRAMTRQYLSWRRRRASSEAVVADVPDRAAVGDLAGGLAARDEMWSLLATLPRNQGAVLVLRFYEDLPDGEIAELLGCSAATVRVHASRALSRLRVALSDTATACLENPS
jgi:RNA polymerase sigma-70 factor (sigma-E family)